MKKILLISIISMFFMQLAYATTPCHTLGYRHGQHTTLGQLIQGLQLANQAVSNTVDQGDLSTFLRWYNIEKNNMTVHDSDTLNLMCLDAEGTTAILYFTDRTHTPSTLIPALHVDSSKSSLFN